MTIHFVYSRWDRWTACGASKALPFGRRRRTTGLPRRITCVLCLRVIGVAS